MNFHRSATASNVRMVSRVGQLSGPIVQQPVLLERTAAEDLAGARSHSGEHRRVTTACGVLGPFPITDEKVERMRLSRRTLGSLLCSHCESAHEERAAEQRSRHGTSHITIRIDVPTKLDHTL